jgi:hypothetical protein
MSNRVSRLLIQESPVQVIPSLATKIGLDQAIVLQQVHYWLGIQEQTRNDRCFKEGRWWVYNTVKGWQSTNFPWMSLKNIERTIGYLEDMGLLLSVKFEATEGNHRKWYSIDYDALCSLDNWDFLAYKATSIAATVEAVKRHTSRSPQNGGIDLPKMGESESVTLGDSSSSKWGVLLYTENSCPEKTTETTQKTGWGCSGVDMELEDISLSSEKDQTDTTADQPGSENRRSAAARPKKVDGYTPEWWVAAHNDYKPKAWPTVKTMYGKSRAAGVKAMIQAFGSEDEALNIYRLVLTWLRTGSGDTPQWWRERDITFENFVKTTAANVVSSYEKAINAGMTEAVPVSTTPGSTPDDLEARKARKQAEILAQARAESDRLMQGAA